jgi:hypothetical protein
MHTRFLSVDLRGQDYSEDLGTNGKDVSGSG